MKNGTSANVLIDKSRWTKILEEFLVPKTNFFHDDSKKKLLVFMLIIMLIMLTFMLIYINIEN